ncbi:MAG: response regulator [Flammeovirgaceae bacterium]
MNYTILHADDHPIIRAGLAAVIGRLPNYEVIEQVSNGKQALYKATSLKPDILILDIDMPKMNGITVAKKLFEEQHSLQIILLSNMLSDEIVQTGRMYGVKGFLSKSSALDEMANCLTHLNNDMEYISNDCRKLLSRKNTNQQVIPQLENHLQVLSNREREVLMLVCKGHSSKGIAKLLNISDRTAEKHRQNICRKLALANSKNSLLNFVVKHKDYLVQELAGLS